MNVNDIRSYAKNVSFIIVNQILQSKDVCRAERLHWLGGGFSEGPKNNDTTSKEHDETVYGRCNRISGVGK